MSEHDEGGDAPSTLAGEILGLPRYRARVRAVSALEERLSPALASAFVARSHEAMRRDPREAMECARLAEIVAAAAGDEAVRNDALGALGQACILHGRFPVALKALDAAAASARGRGDERRAAGLDLLRAQPLLHLERYDEARAAIADGLAVFERVGDLGGRIRALMALGDVAFRTDRPKEALAHYAEVDRILPPDAPPRIRGAVAANRANALEARNRFRAAVRHFDRAREIFLAEGCDHTVAQVEYNAAYAEVLRGRYESALKGYAVTEEVFRKLKDERHLGLVDLDRAEVHLHLHMPEEAAVLAARAEERFRALGMHKEAAQAAQFGAKAAELAGAVDEAQEHLARAERIFTGLGLRERRFACLVQRGVLLIGADRRPEARRVAEEAAALLDGAHGAPAAAAVQLLRARLDLADGLATEALHRADGARMQLRRVHAPRLEIEAHHVMARAYAAREELDESILAYRRAIVTLERTRGGVPPDEYMSAFLAGHADLYLEIVEVLVRAGYPEMAFEFTERAKSRALVDLLSERERHAGGPPRASLTTRRLRTLRERLNAAYRRILRHESGAEERSARSAAREREDACRLEKEMARHLRQGRLRDREGASLEAADAPDLAAVRADLEPDVTLVEYLTTPRELLTFVVTRDTFHAVRQDVPAAELHRLLERFRFHLAKFDGGRVMAEDIVLQATRANLRHLAAHLLDPIRAHLRGRRVVVAPHGVLHGLPFHALPWGDGWVADHLEVVYAPSAAVYAFCRDHHPNTTGPACVFGLPDEQAPQIEREVRGVSRALGSDRVYLGKEATLERLKDCAQEARILHVATHGMFRREQPMLSAIRLADTWLNLYDLYDLDLRAELVVLSTCESGTAGVTPGDEILGLSRGFLYAGTRTLVASQWRVHDSTTAEIMDLFYRRLADMGDAAAALKSAMAEIRLRKPHPYYWAPFFLIGRPIRRRRNPTARRPAVNVPQENPA